MLIMAPSICTSLSPIWQIIGWVLWVFKIVIPIVIIVFGMIDLGKAVVASKDDEIKKSVKSLVMRAIAGIIIFFIPTLVGAIFSLVGEFNDNREEYDKIIEKNTISVLLVLLILAVLSVKDTLTKQINE